jgi:hypothetical protein
MNTAIREREFDSPILRARRARKIGLLGKLRVAQLPQKSVRRIHVKEVKLIWSAAFKGLQLT